MSVSDLLASESPETFDEELPSGDTLVVHAPAFGVDNTVESHVHRRLPPVQGGGTIYNRSGSEQSHMSESRPETSDADEVVTSEDVRGLFDVVEGPVLTTRDVRLLTGVTPERARELLGELVAEGHLRKRVSGQTGLYWQRDSTTVDPPAFLTEKPDEG